MSRELRVISCIAFPELGRRLVRYADSSLCITVPQIGFNVTLYVTVLLLVGTKETLLLRLEEMPFHVSVDLTNMTENVQTSQRISVHLLSHEQYHTKQNWCS